MNGTKRGFAAGSSLKSGTKQLRRIETDEVAVDRARVARAFDVLMNAAMARLRLHYAARIGGLLLLGRADQSAAVAALLNERDTALARLQNSIGESRKEAMRAARRTPRRKRYDRASSAPQPGPRRPARSDPRCGTARAMPGSGHYSP